MDHLEHEQFSQKNVTAVVPVELIFTDVDVRTAHKEHLIPDFTEAWYAHHLLFSDISIIRLEPHRVLFRYLMGDPAATAEPYLDWYAKIHELRGQSPELDNKELLMQRRMEFINMRDYLQTGSSFFGDHPVQVSYRTPGRFNIHDGHHRASFLYCSGLRRIPVRMPEPDYERWLNDNALSETEATIARQQRKLFYTPILHPQFYNVRSERDEVYRTRLDYILEYIGPRNLRDKSVLDIGCNTGYYSRHFTREGAKVTGIEPDSYHFELLEKLNRLENTSFELLTEPLERSQLSNEYEIGLLLTVFYHLMRDPEKREPFLAAVDRSVRSMLFWESGDNVAEEKNMILNATSFKSYVKLADTFGTGKYRELGVFLK
ncbi:class I SAM-dependent methyltransferase [Fontibacillus sp. BL9]|uniref:class I SAM-dependent methyltransferase n=1 Tax=Fontibacillus sp. BL9 TaxID=3389971 RepID=UPI00397A240B